MTTAWRRLILTGFVVSWASWASWMGITTALRAAQAATAPQSSSPDVNSVATRITVLVPEGNAELTVDGKAVPGSGPSRSVESTASMGNAQHTFTVLWRPNSYTIMTRSKTVSVRAGDPAVVDLTIDDPSDRARIIYVPTPQDVVDEMIKLAGVTSEDVVYEPGCGDARITIAAIRAGARRGICVDIEPSRVEDSRKKVKDAGLQDWIDVRLGDALDVHDLSEVTVVFLYMGDQFDLLIRPVLWRNLKVGSRVVSHRFTMGDWAPDRTIIVTTAEADDYFVHLWTVTEDVKRRLAAR